MKKFILLLTFILPLAVIALAQDEKEEKEKNKRTNRLGTDHFFSIDIGSNNYHADGEFPDENNEVYSVRPWGSWYVGLNSLQRTHVTHGLFLEWGGGVSWYNFKFEEENLVISETTEGVAFTLNDAFDYEKSKLTVSYVNLSLVPVYQFGKTKSNDDRKWKDYEDRGFRAGFGGYVGYRIDSYTKLKYEEPGSDDDKKVKDHDNFYLENLRYGLRLQLGYKGSDIFLNYDLNNLFSENRGPELSAVSFGIIL